jgi:hypothetical protein
MDKICYAVVMSAQKLSHYFEAHRVRVLTNQPLTIIFGDRDSSRRMELSKCVVDLKKKKRHQLTSPGRFHRRLDGALQLYQRPRHVHTMAGVLQWSRGQCWSKGCSSPSVTLRHQTEICNMAIVHKGNRQVHK